jgi:hypothetical protein
MAYNDTTPYAGPMPQSSSKATAALVLGICGIFVVPVICSILALVFGYQGRTEIDQSNGYLTGRGMAVAGIVLGWVGIALAVVGLLIFLVLLAAIQSTDAWGTYTAIVGL